MGSEIGQWDEWNHDVSIQWDLLQFDHHRKLQDYNRELNRLYRSHPAFYEVDYHWDGFEWIDFHDVENSVISFIRRAADRSRFLVFACNFTPVPRLNYRIGVPDEGAYAEIMNSDSELFGGSNMGNGGRVVSDPIPMHGRPHSLNLTLPPLAVVIFEPMRPPLHLPAIEGHA